MLSQRSSRRAGPIVAALVAILTLAAPAHAVETLLNAFAQSYDLAPGASSGAITPSANLGVTVLADQTSGGNVGSTIVTVLNSAGHNNELVWSGLESNNGGPVSAASSTPGTHIVYIDYSHCVDLEVNNATSFIVHNACSTTQMGSVKEIW